MLCSRADSSKYADWTRCRCASSRPSRMATVQVRRGGHVRDRRVALSASGRHARWYWMLSALTFKAKWTILSDLRQRRAKDETRVSAKGRWKGYKAKRCRSGLLYIPDLRKSGPPSRILALIQICHRLFAGRCAPSAADSSLLCPPIIIYACACSLQSLTAAWASLLHPVVPLQPQKKRPKQARS